MPFRTDRPGVRIFAILALAASSYVAVACSDDSDDPGPNTNTPANNNEVDIPEGAVGIDVSGVFDTGTEVRDAYTGATTTVGDDGLAYFVPGDEAVVLVEEAADAQSTPDFTWDNATVYFLHTDRFENGDPSNDVGYPGREPADGEQIGIWHGGDFVGLTQRLDYLVDLGVDAIWISFPVEQIHGYVGGGSGDFQHFAYRGYWTLDFTRIDANFGTEEELETLVNEAHDRGIRVVLDVVLNHAGYATMQDLSMYLPQVLSDGWQDWTPTGDENWHAFNDLFIDFGSAAWENWWGKDWIRSSTFSGHLAPGSDDLTRELSFLPDFRTENANAVGPPPFFANKPDTGVEPIPDFTVRQYLVKWVTDWVERFGIDGFRVDTAKHVEFETWVLLKEEATEKLAAWKAANPARALDDEPFWMTGEVFPHGVVRDEYFDNGFDSLINFDFQRVADDIVASPTDLNQLYETYASTINSDPTFNVLTYISSHDTFLFFDRIQEDAELQKDVASAFMLLPGAVQIFYGDESGREAWEASISDAQQKASSPMNWDDMDDGILSHWQKLGRFRKRHPAVGAGTHAVKSTEGATVFTGDPNAPETRAGLVFSRELGDDRVVVAILEDDDASTGDGQ